MEIITVVMTCKRLLYLYYFLSGRKTEHLFKKLLISSCDSCERRASLIPCSTALEFEEEEEETPEEEQEEESCFECPEDDKVEMHDVRIHSYSEMTTTLHYF